MSMVDVKAWNDLSEREVMDIRAATETVAVERRIIRSMEIHGEILEMMSQAAQLMNRVLSTSPQKLQQLKVQDSCTDPRVSAFKKACSADLEYGQNTSMCTQQEFEAQCKEAALSGWLSRFCRKDVTKDSKFRRSELSSLDLQAQVGEMDEISLISGRNLHVKVAEEEGIFRDLGREVEILKSKVKDAEIPEMYLPLNVLEKGKRASALNGENEMLKHKLRQAKSYNKNLPTKMTKMEERLESSKFLMAKLDDREGIIASQHREVEMLISELENVENLKLNWQLKLDEKQEMIATLESQKRILTHPLQEAQFSIGSLQTKMREMEAMLEISTSDLQSKLDEKVGIINDLRNELDRLNCRLEDAEIFKTNENVRLCERQSQDKRLKQELEQAEVPKKALQAKLSKMDRMIQISSSHSQVKVDGLTKCNLEYSNFPVDPDQLEKNPAPVTSFNQNEIMKKPEQVSNINCQGKFSKKHIMISSLHDELGTLKSNLENAEISKALLLLIIYEKQQQIQGCKKKIGRLRKEAKQVDMKERTICSLHDELTKLRCRLEYAEICKEFLLVIIAEQKQRIQGCNNKIGRLKQEVEQVNEKQIMISSLRDELNSLKGKLEDAETSKALLLLIICEKQQQIQAYKIETVKLKQQVEQSENYRTHLQSKIDEVMENNHGLQCKLNRLQNKFSFERDIRQRGQICWCCGKKKKSVAELSFNGLEMWQDNESLGSVSIAQAALPVFYPSC